LADLRGCGSRRGGSGGAESSWANGVEPRGARSHSRTVRAGHVSTSQLTLANLEYGAFRRFPMRSAAARGGECGLPHGTTSPWGVVQPRRAAWDAVSLANHPRVARLHQPADAGRSPDAGLRPAARRSLGEANVGREPHGGSVAVKPPRRSARPFVRGADPHPCHRWWRRPERKPGTAGRETG
jgi:hypothetical protein